MKKILLILIIFCLTIYPAFAWGKKNKAVLTLADSYESAINKESKFIFKTNSRIYFSISNPKGFTSDYIKYQIIKQEDNAHVGGFTRVKNETVRIKNKNNYTDYFLITQKGKYFIQIFNITNLQQWVAIQGFQVVEE